MISIITAVHNQLAMNQLFVENLRRYTQNPFELIIIDNASTDGSREFFEASGAKVIANDGNYSYPRCQNQGIAVAQYDHLVFMNNDVIVSPGWDQGLIETMQHNDLDVVTVSGIEHLETAEITQQFKRRWKFIKNVLSLFGHSRTTFTLMHKWMYGNWQRFCEGRRRNFKYQIKPGFVGNTVLIHRRALDKIGLWDERIQAADFDLYLRTLQRAKEVGDIKPMHIALDVFVHHYIRITLKAGYPPFADRDNLIDLDAKWPEETRAALAQMND